jgi:hypothetical protein
VRAEGERAQDEQIERSLEELGAGRFFLGRHSTRCYCLSGRMSTRRPSAWRIVCVSPV